MTIVKDHRELIKTCTCKQTPLPQRMALWQRRARKIMSGLPRRGHRINQREYTKTLELLVGIEKGHPESFSIQNWTKSHHLISCPCSNRQNPKGTVKVLPLTQCQPSMVGV